MTAADVALEMAQAARQPGLSAESLLHRLTALTARRLPGCCGASLTVWEGTRRVRSSVSHMDLAVLRELPGVPAAEDPERQAMTREHAVMIPDTLVPDRWQRFCAGAATLGIRSAGFQPVCEGARVTLGCYATTPGAFDDTGLVLLAGRAAALLQDAEYRGDLERDVRGLRASLATRSLIDQAAGMIMAQRGCTAQQALAELNRLSQHGNAKLADVAVGMVSRRSAG